MANPEREKRVAAGKKAARRGRRATGGELHLVKKLEDRGYERVYDKRRQEAKAIVRGVDVVCADHEDATLTFQNKRMNYDAPLFNSKGRAAWREVTNAHVRDGVRGIPVVRYYQASTLKVGSEATDLAVLGTDDLLELYELAWPPPDARKLCRQIDRLLWLLGTIDGGRLVSLETSPDSTTFTIRRL